MNVRSRARGWGNEMYEDGGDEYEFGGQHDTREDFSEKQYESDDPNDDEDGYKGDYNVQGLDHPDDDANSEAGASDDGDSFLQAKSKKSLLSTKKGWGNEMYEDGGDEYEYGGQHDTREDFSEKQYESDDPNDDEDGYKG